MLLFFRNYLNSTRVWTLNFVFAGNIINISLLYKNGIEIDYRIFLCTLLIQILVNNISNLVNSYYDFIKGLDNEETSGDRTMFKYSLSLNQIYLFTKLTFALTILITIYLNYLISNNNLKSVIVLSIIVLNTFLAFFYTAPPFEFKYNFLGELSASIGYFFIGSFSYYCQTNNGLNDLFHYSMIFTLGSLSIIYSNNVRDIKVDKMANIKTIPIFLGEKISYIKSKTSLFYIDLLSAKMVLKLSILLSVGILLKSNQ
ncbi:hypothetical protein DICPUDRAFT_152580 [Dictyostelium purpureum]|uniref:1,4-dihydroxy-2-naphthoate octaprenyltransferase n=1 Tax=Dictyostelium purpureum TaxID=5786 RepID=F0ZLR4_DICPU|nr:uncharacterized protein DICPUDRAFT_152580 [Dictyostelium purpureum]EGC35103.1 hypothetical protein DICPUDRAFT_152580 [Dictyostelium purpureum]|eukprot:XP_003288355.1 hypothetical protein DICPUDRAFT_152580 [Dictyostelium purpureum]